MSREDTCGDRSEMAKMAENYFKERDNWGSLDAARIGGRAWSEMPSYDHMSDEQLIQKYLDDQRQRE
mgnify:CR=1 FL=1